MNESFNNLRVQLPVPDVILLDGLVSGVQKDVVLLVGDPRLVHVLVDVVHSRGDRRRDQETGERRDS